MHHLNQHYIQSSQNMESYGLIMELSEAWANAGVTKDVALPCSKCSGMLRLKAEILKHEIKSLKAVKDKI